jgi:hypothetical protein
VGVVRFAPTVFSGYEKKLLSAGGGAPGFFALFYIYGFAMPKNAGLKRPVFIFANNVENMGGVYAA